MKDKNQTKNFKLQRMAYAVMLATAAPASIQMAYAGAGWGVSSNPNSVNYNAATGIGQVRTFYANSELPVVANGKVTGGLRKFIDTVPDLTPAGANSLGQYLPVSSRLLGTADTTSYPGSDYYEIAIVQYQEKMHPDMPAPTTLRGYVQLDRVATNSAGAQKSAGSGAVNLSVLLGYPVKVALENADHSLAKDINGNNILVDAYAYDKPHYLGPALITLRGVPVRMKYNNCLPVGAATGNATKADVNGFQKVDPATFQRNGDMFIPVDETLAGAGFGPDQFNKFQQNRAEIHLHGGLQPWISDGTPHQWTVPVGDNAVYQKGESFENVPDMPDPGPGAGTLYWSNDQSGRLMAYHDHVSGITRLNAYIGEAAGYLLVDMPGAQTHNEHTLPIPGTGAHALEQKVLVIQDKGFVPTNIATQDAKWDTTAWGGPGSLYFPHVYETNQDPWSADGTNPVGRWDWGPYFWPVFPSQYVLPTGEYGDVTTTPEAFMDTPIVNGAAYPSMTVEPKAYRFRIFSIGNDRFFNLGLYEAEPLSIGLAAAGTGYSNPQVKITPDARDTTAAGAQALALFGLTSISVPAGFLGTYNIPPKVIISAPPAGGIQATAVANLQGTGGMANRGILNIAVTNPGNGYTTPPTITVVPAPGETSTGAVTFTATSTVGLAGIDVISYGTGYNYPPTVDIVDPTGTGAVAVAAVNSEVKMVPFDTTGIFPNKGGLTGTGWGQPDSRAGGVPDPTRAGPDIIQIGTEGGLLPAVATIPSTPINYEYNKRSVTVLNVLEHGLFLGSAERADVVIDFARFPGKTLILYNDSPAPVPAGDPRLDYYTGDPDFSASGGAPTTLPGYGPNTRTVMQIKVGTTVTPGSISYPTVALPSGLQAFDPAPLAAELPLAYAATQDRPIVAESAYNAAFNGGAPVWGDQFGKISTGSLQQPVFSFTSGAGNANFSSVQVQSGGHGYIVPPRVDILNGNVAVAGANATATLKIDAITVDPLNPGSGYKSAPNITIASNNGTGTGATASATIKVAKVNVALGGSGYSATDVVQFSAPPAASGGQAASGTLNLDATGAVLGVTLVSPGSGYVIPPTVRICGAGSTPTNCLPATGKGAQLTASMGIDRVVVTSPNPATPAAAGGYGYTDMRAVQVTFAAQAGATPPNVIVTGAVDAVTLLNPGVPGPVPTIQMTNQNPAGYAAPVDAIAVATAQGVYDVKPKAIQELFEPTFGRMNSTLGVELPLTTALAQTTIPLNYIDPTTEKIADGETQIWKITHNGVDTHTVHFHMLDVQMINRVGWDGTIKVPPANEVGWKETVRMNPLEDIYVAVRPKQPPLPGFGLPQAVRHRDPSQPDGSPLGFTQVNPITGQAPATTIVNSFENFDWEYVWHCHILGHEENDMMRPFVLNVGTPAPVAPDLTAASINGVKVDLKWLDNSSNEFRFDIQRATQKVNPDGTFATVLVNGVTVSDFGPWVTIGSALANATGFTDTTIPATDPAGLDHQYRVGAVAADATAAAMQAVVTRPAPTQTVWSKALTANAAGTVPAAPTALTLAPSFVAAAAPTLANPGSYSIAASWHDNSTNEAGFFLERSADGGVTWTPVGATTAVIDPVTNTTVANFTAPANAVGQSDVGLLEAWAYQYRVSAVNVNGVSGTATASITTPFAPAAAPTSLTATASATDNTAVVLSWANGTPQTYITVSGVGLPAGATLNTVAMPVGGVWTLAAGTTSATLAGLAPNATVSYPVTVSSVNAGDPAAAAGTYAVGVAPAAAASTVSANTAYAAPGALTTAKTTTATSVSLSLTASPVSGYTIVRSGGTQASQTFYVAAIAGTTNWTDPTTLTQGTAYTYTVTPFNGVFSTATGGSAVNGGSAGAPVTVNATTLYATSAGMSSLFGSTPTANSAQLTWATTVGPVTGFTIVRTDNIGGVAVTTYVSAATNPTGWTDNSVAAGITYSYTVTPWNGQFSAATGPATGLGDGGNAGTPSATASVTTPASLTATIAIPAASITASSVTLNLGTTNTGVVGAQQATSFIVTSCLDNGTGGCASAASSTTVPATNGAATYVFSGLQAGTKYNYTVAAVSGVAPATVTGPVQNASATTTASLYWVGAPTGLTATISATSVPPRTQIAFTDGSGPALVPPAGLTSMNETQFVIERSTDGVNYAQLTTVTQSAGTGTGKTYNDTNMVAGNTYWYRVKAEYIDPTTGVSTPSSYVYVGPANFTVPDPIAAAPTASAVTGTGLTLNWLAPTSTNGAGVTGIPVTGYTVTATAPAGVAAPVVAASTTTPSRSVTGLVAGTTYTFSVVATNALGTQAVQSPVLTQLTAPVVPGRPTASTTGTTAGSGTANVSWTTVAGATSYVIQARNRVVNANNWNAWFAVTGTVTITGTTASVTLTGLPVAAGGTMATTQYSFHVAASNATPGVSPFGGTSAYGTSSASITMP